MRYDVETGFYLTGTRYYDPEIGRFINADGYLSTGQDITGFNMFAYCGNNPVNRIDPTGKFWKKIGAFITNAWETVKRWTENIFGAGASIVSTATYTEEIIPEPSPIVIETGTITKQIISECGDSTKPISAYADGSLTNPVQSSKVGVKINIAKIGIDASWGKEATGITYSYTNNGTTRRFGIIFNQRKLKYGIEYGNAIKWDNFEESNFTNISISGMGLLAAYAFAICGQTISQPAYQYQ